MCGIIGYVGYRDPREVIINCLSRLEYRGYDSAGIALAGEGMDFFLCRCAGKIERLKEKLKSTSLKEGYTIGIGHTRWATHGEPTEINAHPQVSGRIAVIHNGIIENYHSLKLELSALGRDFLSETDTEVIAHLLDVELLKGHDHVKSLRNVVKRLKGSYAFLAIDRESPDTLMFAKNSSPMIIGVGKGENFIASDIPAILEYTRDVVILDDGELGTVTSDDIYLERNAVPKTLEISHVDWNVETAQKEGYEHFFLKEVYEQPRVIANTLGVKIGDDLSSINLETLTAHVDVLRDVERVVFCGCGSAYHVGLLGKLYMESIVGIPTSVEYASEYRYNRTLLDDKTLFIAISQSGETVDTLGAVEKANEKAFTLSICNVVGSTIARRSKAVVYTLAGPEISVASSKAFMAQIVETYILTLFIAHIRGVIAESALHERLLQLSELPEILTEILELDTFIEKISNILVGKSGCFILGRGMNYVAALEGALKIKELSYIFAEGYPAGEMKHGPMSLVDENLPVVVLIPNHDVLYEKTFSNLREIHSRNGVIISITDDEEKAVELSDYSNEVITVPKISYELSPCTMIVPMQLLAYYTAVKLGFDVDKPRNLAKSVTVE